MPLTWTIEYTQTARAQLRKLDKQMARRIVDYMNERVAGLEEPRSLGKALTGPLGELWRYRVGDCRVICDIQDAALRVLVVRVGSRGKVYVEGSPAVFRTTLSGDRNDWPTETTGPPLRLKSAPRCCG